MQINSEFAAACALLGVGYADVALLLDVRPDSARAWINGRRTPPEAAWAALRDLYQAQWGGGDPAPAEALLARALARLKAARRDRAI
jgi:hypothetical protein